MDYVLSGVSYIRRQYNKINPATLSGAIDIIVCENEETGELVTSPFHVRFGKLGVLSPKEKVINVSVNGQKIDQIQMKLGEQGEAFFVTESGFDETVPFPYVTSPMATSPLASRPSTPGKLDSSRGRKRRSRRSLNRQEFFNRENHEPSESESESSPELEFDPALLSPAEDISEATKDEIDTFNEEFDNYPPPDELCHRLERLNARTNPRARRASTGCQFDENTENLASPAMVWPYGELPQQVGEESAVKSRVQPNEIRDIVLDRVINADPESSPSPSRPIRRRRRFDSEPPMAIQSQNSENQETENLNGLSPLSPLSDALDSGTDCWEDDHDLAISLGGNLTENNQILDAQAFKAKQINFADFNADPQKYMGNPSLIIRMGEKYYNWHAASAIFMSLILFNRPIDDEKVKNLQNETIARKRSWFSWGRTVSYTESSGSLKSENSESLTVRSDDSTKTPEKSTPPMSRSFSVPPQEAASRPRNLQFETMENNYKKSLVLSSEDLKKLNLNYGENKICFFHTNMLQGTTKIDASIYLWKSSDKIVVSDIDGTITRSDVMGYLSPLIGKDWSQEGITKLYKQISDNGYRFIFLSSRAIGQASMTKSYLDWVRQDGIPLPRGAVMLNPTSLFNAFHKEVIARAPEEFKISCLQGIKDIFPKNRNPFWAGFGNRITDVKSYRNVEIDDKRIYIVNHLGHLKDQQDKLKTYTTCYTELGTKVDHFFPLLKDSESDNEGLNSHTHWRLDLPDVDFSEFG